MVNPTYQDFLTKGPYYPGVLRFGGARMALLDVEAGFWGLRRQMEALVGPRLTDTVLQQGRWARLRPRGRPAGEPGAGHHAGAGRGYWRHADGEERGRARDRSSGGTERLTCGEISLFDSASDKSYN